MINDASFHQESVYGVT